jgi:deoxyribonuclease II
MYGQHFACYTLKPEDLFNLAGVMSINIPQVFATRVKIAQANITALISQNVISNANSYSYTFKSLGGLEFTYFAKSGAANLDLYEDVISPYYDDGMIVQSWGRPYESDFCQGQDYNYTNVNVAEIDVGKYWWTGYYDHSKWGLGYNKTFVCFSDINRMYSQWVRGGGAVCTVNQDLYKYLRSFITKYDLCPSTKTLVYS